MRPRAAKPAIPALALAAALATAAVASAAAPAADAIAEKDIRPLMADLCTDCHGGRKPKGALSFEAIDLDLRAGADIETWGRILDQLVLGEMPPAEGDQPTAPTRPRR